MRVRLLVLTLLTPVAYAQDLAALDAATGKSLFELNWVQAPASTASADGLGPYYNARSCSACHMDGGSGDDTLATMNVVVEDPHYGNLLQLHAITGMKPEARIAFTYEPAALVEFSDGARVQLYAPQVVVTDLQYGELIRNATLRRAPALGGLALLEEVPATQLRAREDPADADGDGISGTWPKNGGRFNWKAGAATLREQTARALSGDLGLSSSLRPGTAGDCVQSQIACIDAARAVTGDVFEATDVVLDLLVAYLRMLPPPVSAPSSLQGGAALFTSVGCTGCHTPQLQTRGGKFIYPFSDLLLHDLGSGLAAGWDPASANEWRTAPLWGLGHRSRFLHDGRAGSLEEAILWHGGEAERVREAYRHLNGAERAVLHDWLLGL
jgi:CxxC motif-containing protein (DUF1111 family)